MTVIDIVAAHAERGFARGIVGESKIPDARENVRCLDGLSVLLYADRRAVKSRVVIGIGERLYYKSGIRSRADLESVGHGRKRVGIRNGLARRRVLHLEIKFRIDLGSQRFALLRYEIRNGNRQLGSIVLRIEIKLCELDLVLRKAERRRRLAGGLAYVAVYLIEVVSEEKRQRRILVGCDLRLLGIDDLHGAERNVPAGKVSSL